MSSRPLVELNAGTALLLQSGSLEPRHALAKMLSQVAVWMLVCASVLAPGVNLFPGVPQVRMEALLLTACGAVYAWLLLAGIARPPRFHAIYVIAALFCLSVAISLAYGALVLRHVVLLRDFYELPKVWMPAAFFLLAYEAQLSERALRRLLDAMAWVTGAICLYGMAQYFDLGFTFWLNRYYSGGEHHDIALSFYHRVYSTLANPNVLGQFLSWMMLTYTLAYLFRVGSWVRNLGIPLACLVTLVLTGSRYGLIAVAFGMVLMIALALAAYRRATGLVTVLLLMLAFGAIFANVKSAAHVTAKRFDELLHPMQASSLRARLDVLWVEAAGYIATSPWLGHGPAKQIFTEVYTDSEYLDVMKQYGLLGLLAYLAYYVWPLLRYAGVFRAAAHLPPPIKSAVRANLLLVGVGIEMIGTALVMNIGEFTFFNWILLGFFWLWIGLSVRSADFVRELVACNCSGARVPEARQFSYVHG